MCRFGWAFLKATMKLGKRCLQHSAGLAEQQALQLAQMLKWEPSAEFSVARVRMRHRNCELRRIVIPVRASEYRLRRHRRELLERGPVRAGPVADEGHCVYVDYH
jgi:hypothetical protein